MKTNIRVARKSLLYLGAMSTLLIVAALPGDIDARGFGGGFRGGSFGGGYRGASFEGYRGGSVGGFSAAGHYGGYAGVNRYGAGSGYREGGSVVGPRGGYGSAGAGSGSYTTNRGTTINYGGAGYRGTTPGGYSYGRGIGGVSVEGAGGNTYRRATTGGYATGPGGRGVAGKTSVGVGTGPGGSFATGSTSRAAFGPSGFAGYRGGVAIGPNGAAALRTGVAVGPGGAVGARTTVAGNRYGTYRVSRTTMATQGTYVRRSFGYYGAFRPGWYARYPGAWYATGWAAGWAWRTASWAALASYCAYPVQPVYYNYGDNVVYQGDTVYVNGEPSGTVQQATQQANVIADIGQQANVTKAGDDWQPLGVFALVQGDEKTSYKLFQLAINKQGIMRGNYYDAMTDTTLPVKGAVQQKTQRAAWTVGDNTKVVYEAGIANLTQEETPILVHFGDNDTQQFTLVRVEQNDKGQQQPAGTPQVVPMP